MNAPKRDDWARKSAGAARFSLASSLGTGALQLVQVAALARILTPADFAVAAIATIVTSFLARFADFGISSAIVHFQSVADDELSTLYIVNLALGGCLAILMLMASPWVAGFYGSPDLEPFLRVLALYIIVATSGAQFRALHQKALDFRTLASAEVGGSLTACVTSIGLALAGSGVMSIAWGALAGALVCAAVLIAWGLPIHRPRLRFYWQGSKRFVRYGAYQAGEAVLDTINMQMDSLLIGRLTGMTAVGYYAPIKNLCFKLVSVVNPILTRVAFPVMSKVQDDLPRVGRIYLLQVRLIATVTCPAYLFAFVAAAPIVDIVFGPRWQPAAPILRALALWAAFVSFGNPVGSLLLATGRVRRSLLWNVFASVVTPVTVLIAAPHGIYVVAWTMVGLQAALFIPGWLVLIRPSAGVGLAAYVQNLLHPVIPAILSAGVAYTTCGVIESAAIQLLVTAATFAAAYALGSWFLNRQPVVLVMQTLFRRNNAT